MFIKLYDEPDELERQWTGTCSVGAAVGLHHSGSESERYEIAEVADGRKMRAQVWSPGPYVRSYWLKVWEREARFPGEMRLTYADADGNLSAPDGEVYNARGESRIHLTDGNVCYGGHNSDAGWRECSNCMRERIASMVGKYVQVTVAGDPMYGSTCRWGTLREIADGRAVFDGDLADCSGIRCYPSKSFKLDEIREIKLYTRAA